MASRERAASSTEGPVHAGSTASPPPAPPSGSKEQSSTSPSATAAPATDDEVRSPFAARGGGSRPYEHALSAADAATWRRLYGPCKAAKQRLLALILTRGRYSTFPGQHANGDALTAQRAQQAPRRRGGSNAPFDLRAYLNATRDDLVRMLAYEDAEVESGDAYESERSAPHTSVPAGSSSAASGSASASSTSTSTAVLTAPHRRSSAQDAGPDASVGETAPVGSEESDDEHDGAAPPFASFRSLSLAARRDRVMLRHLLTKWAVAWRPAPTANGSAGKAARGGHGGSHQHSHPLRVARSRVLDIAPLPAVLLRLAELHLRLGRLSDSEAVLARLWDCVVPFHRPSDIAVRAIVTRTRLLRGERLRPFVGLGSLLLDRQALWTYARAFGGGTVPAAHLGLEAESGGNSSSGDVDNDCAAQGSDGCALAYAHPELQMEWLLTHLGQLEPPPPPADGAPSPSAPPSSSAASAASGGGKQQPASDAHLDLSGAYPWVWQLAGLGNTAAMRRKRASLASAVHNRTAAGGAGGIGGASGRTPAWARAHALLVSIVEGDRRLLGDEHPAFASTLLMAGGVYMWHLGGHIKGAAVGQVLALAGRRILERWAGETQLAPVSRVSPVYTLPYVRSLALSAAAAGLDGDHALASTGYGWAANMAKMRVQAAAQARFRAELGIGSHAADTGGGGRYRRCKPAASAAEPFPAHAFAPSGGTYGPPFHPVSLHLSYCTSTVHVSVALAEGRAAVHGAEAAYADAMSSLACPAVDPGWAVAEDKLLDGSYRFQGGSHLFSSEVGYDVAAMESHITRTLQKGVKTHTVRGPGSGGGGKKVKFIRPVNPSSLGLRGYFSQPDYEGEFEDPRETGPQPHDTWMTPEVAENWWEPLPLFVYGHGELCHEHARQTAAVGTLPRLEAALAQWSSVEGYRSSPDYHALARFTALSRFRAGPGRLMPTHLAVSFHREYGHMLPLPHPAAGATTGAGSARGVAPPEDGRGGTHVFGDFVVRHGIALQGDRPHTGWAAAWLLSLLESAHDDFSAAEEALPTIRPHNNDAELAIRLLEILAANPHYGDSALSTARSLATAAKGGGALGTRFLDAAVGVLAGLYLLPVQVSMTDEAYGEDAGVAQQGQQSPAPAPGAASGAAGQPGSSWGLRALACSVLGGGNALCRTPSPSPSAPAASAAFPSLPAREPRVPEEVRFSALQSAFDARYAGAVAHADAAAEAQHVANLAPPDEASFAQSLTAAFEAAIAGSTANTAGGGGAKPSQAPEVDDVFRAALRSRVGHGPVPPIRAWADLSVDTLNEAFGVLAEAAAQHRVVRHALAKALLTGGATGRKASAARAYPPSQAAHGTRPAPGAPVPTFTPPPVPAFGMLHPALARRLAALERRAAREEAQEAALRAGNGAAAAAAAVANAAAGAGAANHQQQQQHQHQQQASVKVSPSVVREAVTARRRSGQQAAAGGVGSHRAAHGSSGSATNARAQASRGPLQDAGDSAASSGSGSSAFPTFLADGSPDARRRRQNVVTAGPPSSQASPLRRGRAGARADAPFDIADDDGDESRQEVHVAPSADAVRVHPDGSTAPCDEDDVSGAPCGSAAPAAALTSSAGDATEPLLSFDSLIARATRELMRGSDYDSEELARYKADMQRMVMRALAAEDDDEYHRIMGSSEAQRQEYAEAWVDLISGADGDGELEVDAQRQPGLHLLRSLVLPSQAGSQPPRRREDKPALAA